jgi:hypothetical protein
MRVNPDQTNIICKKILATVVAILIVNVLCVSSVSAQKQELSADEAKAEIIKLGTGKKAGVRITTSDNTKIKGWLSFAGEDHFTVTADNGNSTDIKYSDVRQVKSLRPSKGLTAAVAIVVVGAAALVFLFAGTKH